MKRVLTLLCLVYTATPGLAQRDLKDIPNPDPEIERRSFQVAPGFEVNLYAADPLLAKPIAMNFDSQGRLWVACSSVYPQIKPGQTSHDKIIILEDLDGDGRADKTTVFAEGLLIPTGIEPGDGGVYVANSTDLVHLRDTDGDGKADQQRVVLSGFGTEDTHHILHSLRWGPDGMLYFNQSIYIHSHIETPHGVRRLNGGGIWRFRPETMELEVFVHGFVNPWGHHFDRWGQSFATDGAFGEGINYLLPGAYYTTAPDAVRILAGLNPGSPKHCGLEILSGRHLPADWQGNMITNDFRGHRVCRFVVTEEGSGFTSQEKSELIKTAHGAFRPVDVKMGPDGAIYIADWYNPIIQHGEVDFRDPRRDQGHGRIWRVTAKNRPALPRPQLVDAATPALLELLKSPEYWTRLHAKRVLKERGKTTLPALAEWVAKLSPTDADYEHHLLEGLWTYQALDVVEPHLLATLLQAHEARARAAAVRVMQFWSSRLENPLELLAARVIDDHPRVRLEAVRTLARLQSTRAAAIAMQALDRPVDKYLDYALWLTARELQPYWMPALEKGAFDFDGNVSHLLFALQAAGSSEALKPLVGLLRTGKIAKEREEAVLGLIAAVGGPDELAMVLGRLLADKSRGKAGQLLLLTALEKASRQRDVRPAGNVSKIGELLHSDDNELRTAVIRLVGIWHIEPLRNQLTKLARDIAAPDSIRQAAFESLARLGGVSSLGTITEMAKSGQPSSIRPAAVAALADLDLQSAARLAIEQLGSSRSNASAEILFAPFLQKKQGAAALMAALSGRRLPADVAKLGIRAARAAGQDNQDLLDALSKAGGLTAGPKILSSGELQELVAQVRTRGDAARGELVYRRKDLACFRCHAIAGAGGQVGPDLVSIGASAQIDYLIESILQPNKIVKENYHSLVVNTRDGRFFTGIKVRESKTELVLRDAEDREISIPGRLIDERQNGRSLMPDGLADGLTQAELVDLVRFLSELGRVGPYAVTQDRVARRWQVLEPSKDAYHLLAGTRFASVTSGDSTLHWTPAYATVHGTLPLDDLPRLAFRKPPDTGVNHYIFTRCQIEVSTPGKIRLELDMPGGTLFWFNQSPVEMRKGIEMDVEAEPGIHWLTFAIPIIGDPGPVTCKLKATPGSQARARLVGGK